MKRRIISFVLVQIFGLLFPCTLSATGAKHVPSSSQAVQKFTEAELTEKFNKILDEKLSANNICITLRAARQLDELMREGAAEIVQKNQFDLVPEAEKNIRTFADTLLTKGTKHTGQIKITEATVFQTLHGVPNPHFALFGGLCPLFPICR